MTRMTGVRLLEAEQVAEQLSVSARWILAEARAGRIPSYRLGRRVRFDAEELAAWLADHHRPALDDRRVSYPNGPAKPARRAGSRGRVPTVTPPAALYPDAHASSGAR